MGRPRRKASKQEASTYEIVVDFHGKKHEFAFSDAGKLLMEERTDEED